MLSSKDKLFLENFIMQINDSAILSIGYLDKYLAVPGNEHLNSFRQSFENIKSNSQAAIELINKSK